MSMPARRGPRAAALAVGVALLATLAGCTGDGDDPGAEPSATGSETVEEVTTRVTIGRVTGRLPKPARAKVADQVQGVVDEWYDAALLGSGESLAESAEQWLESCPGFTEGACARARRDRDLTTLAALADRIEGVAARKRSVRLDILAVDGRPVGATARVRLVADTTGEVERTVRIGGRLLLTPTDGGWQVFGYDLTKGGA